MPTLRQDIQTLLASTNPAGGTWYAQNTRQPPAYPYLVWLVVVSPTNTALQGASDLQNTRIQIDVHAQNVSDLDALQRAVAAAFAASSITNVPLQVQDLTEPDTRSYRTSMDYSVWATN